MVSPTLEQFVARSQHGNLIPVYREILADLETPVSAFLKVAGAGSRSERPAPNLKPSNLEPGMRPQGAHAFLLESVEGGERIGRYSFIGGNPFLILKTKGRQVEIRTSEGTQRRELGPTEDPLSVLKELLGGFQFVPDPDLPPFCGGAVGYIGYD